MAIECSFISERKSKFECYYNGCPHAGAGCKKFDELVDFDYLKNFNLLTKGAANGKNEKEKDDGQKGRAEKEKDDGKKSSAEKGSD